MISPTGEEYGKRKSAANVEFAHWSSKSSTYAVSSLSLAIVLCFFVIRLVQNETSPALTGTCFVALVFCGALMMRARRRASHAMRLVSLYEAGLARIRGEKTQTGHTGDAYVPPGHIYARDLDITGSNSLFGMLATTRTALGHQALADFLLYACHADDATQRQLAVQELAPLYDLREQVALLGRSAFEELPADSFERWLAGESTSFPAWLRPALLLIHAVWIVVLTSGLLLHTDESTLLRNVIALLAVQAALCLKFRKEVRTELNLAEKLGGQTAILRSGLRLLRTSRFQSGLLQSLQQEASGDDIALGRLQRLLELVDQRAKEWFYMFSTLLSMGTHAAVGLQRWKWQHAEIMRKWLRVWSQFDALLALSAYATENAENVYPEITSGSDGSAMFVGRGLRHPLLPYAEAVPNDIALDTETRFLLISGSNMAGKSTLLRAVGTTAVLAMAGAPVPAESLKMCALEIGASLAVEDSLAERKSKFLAEVERLRAIVDLAQENRGRTLFLVDEIFSGTNSLDRKAAAEAVLRSLVAAGAVGGLSTHDLTLTVLADEPLLHGMNVHMASPDEENPLAFDYVLKPGINQTTNAMAILRMLGLLGSE